MGANFDGYWLFKYLTDGHCLSPYTCKHCIVFKQFNGLNFDGLAGKHQKRQNFLRQNFALYGIYDQSTGDKMFAGAYNVPVLSYI